MPNLPRRSPCVDRDLLFRHVGFLDVSRHKFSACPSSTNTASFGHPCAMAGYGHCHCRYCYCYWHWRTKHILDINPMPGAPCYHRQIPHGSLLSSRTSIMEKQHSPTTSSNPMASSANAWLGRYGISTAIRKSNDEELQ